MPEGVPWYSFGQKQFPGGALKNFAKVTEKHLRRSLILIKLQTKACNFVKRDSGKGVFL